MNRPAIDPALGLDLISERTLTRDDASVSIVIPAHNEEDSIQEVVSDCLRSLEILKVQGEVVVSASGCTDSTASRGKAAGAVAIEAPIGKGAAVRAGVEATTGSIVCLIDGDIRYYGETPLAALLVEPIIHGIADATIADLYWRPLYPQMWLHAFFTPAASVTYPEMLTKVGSSPWSGQRAARRELWPADYPEDFTVDLDLLIHWNRDAVRMRPVLTDDWTNPQRPKPDLMAKELDVLVSHAQQDGRISAATADALRSWYNVAHDLMATYRHGVDDPQAFERQLLTSSLAALRAHL